MNSTSTACPRLIHVVLHTDMTSEKCQQNDLPCVVSS